MTAALIDFAAAREDRWRAALPAQVRGYLTVWLRVQDDIATLRRLDPDGTMHTIVSKEWSEATKPAG